MKDLDPFNHFFKSARCWIQVGVKLEIVEDIIESASLKGESCFLAAPELSSELENKLRKKTLKRDCSLKLYQRYAGTVLSALAEAMNMVIDKNKKQVDKALLNRRLFNAAIVASELFHMLTQDRRAFIIAGLTKDMKSRLSSTIPKKLLFGDNLSYILGDSEVMENSNLEQNFLN